MTTSVTATGAIFGGPGVGALGGPAMQHNYKRALIGPPPRCFSVEVLPPVKFGSAHCYGMHITPHTAERPDNRSSSSGSSHREYEIWRRWEDCLWFQEILEMEYSVMAREKRTRLARGKGVKKNGVYIHSDQAASFESLPPGPEAQSIAKDIHEIVPKLTKKATIFRASQATIDQRGREFKNMIHTLFQDDVPTLIKELRDQRIIRDFFGTWRRDKDLARKSSTSLSPANHRTSVTSSAFSMYFAGSNISLQLPNSFSAYPTHPPLPSTVPPSPSNPTTITAQAPYSESDHTTSSSSLSSSSHLQPPATAPMGSNWSVKQNESDDDSKGLRAVPRSFRWSTGSSRSSDSSQDIPTHFPPDVQWHDQSGLQALPEDQELTSDMGVLNIGATDNVRPIRRPRINSCPDRGNRNGLVFATTPPQRLMALDSDSMSDVTDLGPCQGPIQPTSPPNTSASTSFDTASRPVSMAFSTFSDLSQQPSWRTSIFSESSLGPRESCPDINRAHTDSPDLLDEALAEMGEPDKQAPPSFEYRASVSTLGSLAYDYAFDPALGSQASLQRSLSLGSRRRRGSVISNASTTSAGGLWYEQEEFIDAYFYDPSLRVSPPPPDVPHSAGRECLSQDFSMRTAAPERFPKPFQNRPAGQFHLPWTPQVSPPASPTLSADTFSLASPASSVSAPDTLTVKVILQDTIVLVRVAHSTPLAEVRARIVDKYAKQERVLLPPTFAIGYVPPLGDRAASLAGRPRSNSTSSHVALQAVRYITTDAEWRAAVDSCTGKLSIRLLNTHA